MNLGVRPGFSSSSWQNIIKRWAQLFFVTSELIGNKGPVEMEIPQADGTIERRVWPDSGWRLPHQAESIVSTWMLF